MKTRYLLWFMASSIFANEFNTSEFPNDFPFSNPNSMENLASVIPSNNTVSQIIPEPAQEMIYYNFDPQHFTKIESDQNTIEVMPINTPENNQNIMTMTITNIQTNSITNIYFNNNYVVETTNIIEESRVIELTNVITNTVTNMQTNITQTFGVSSNTNQNLIDTQNFIRAAYSGDLFVLKQLLNRGISPDSRSITDKKNGTTALITAAGQRRFAVLELLLKNGANPNLSSSYNKLHGITPLMVAAMHGPVENVDLLITYGADINKQTSGIVTGNSALSAAIGANQEEIVRILLKNGADINHTINSRLYYGITPLMLAVDKGNKNIVSMLLEQKNININASDSDGKSALVYAYIRGKFDIIRILINNGASTHLSDQEISNIINKYRKREIEKKQKK
ncbi:MAG: ankyrin repeat domain-containing protein [Brevinema sp.]